MSDKVTQGCCKRDASPHTPKNEHEKPCVYIVRCADGTLYTGWTNDIENRIKAHNSGKGAKYTRGRLPVSLVYTECADDKASALKREAAIKKLPLSKKLALISSKTNAL